MRKTELFLGTLMLFCMAMCASARDNQINMSQTNQNYNVLVSTNYQVSVTSSAAVTVAVIEGGGQRIFQNVGNSDMYVTKSTTTVSGNGWALRPYVVYIEDKYFGNMYFQSATETNTLCVEEVTQQL